MAMRLRDGRTRLILLAFIGLAWASSSAARAQAAKTDDPTVSELLVRASPTPAMWRVAKGSSELLILGVVSPTPAGGAWNTRAVAHALEGARILMLSPGSTPGLAWANFFPASQRYRLGQAFGRKLAREIGPEAESRLERTALAIHQPPARYSDYRPGPAGMVLLEDSWVSRGLSGARVDDAVIALAKAAHVPVVKVDEGGSLPLIDAMPSMTPTQHAACLREALDQFDWEAENVGPEFRAWASGDLAELRTHYRPLSLCSDSIPGGEDRRNRALGVWRKALEQALAIPGRAVVVMDLGDLLEPSDLLAAFRAEGATVTAPKGGDIVRPGLMLATTAAALDPVAPIERATDPEIALERAPEITFDGLGGEGGRGGVVDLAGPGTTCSVETPTGSLIAVKVCHSAEDWAYLRSLNERVLWEFAKHRQRPSPMIAPGLGEPSQ